MRWCLENFFTRDGSFYVDGAGNLAMTSLGYNVMGWQVDPETGNIKKDTVSALRIMSAANMTYPPEATSQAYLSGIIDKNDTDVTSENGRGVNLKILRIGTCNYICTCYNITVGVKYLTQLNRLACTGKLVVTGPAAAAAAKRGEPGCSR